MTLTQHLYRRSGFGHGNGVLRLATPLVLRFDPLNGLGEMSFSRASAATYSANLAEPAVSYAAGGSLADATVTRASAANQTRELSA